MAFNLGKNFNQMKRKMTTNIKNSLPDDYLAF